jgi:TonB family protein
VPPAQSPPRALAAVPAAQPLMTVNPVDLALPIRVPTVTPHVDLVHALVGAPDPAPFVRAGGAGLGGIAAPLGGGGAWLAEQVDEPAAIEKDSPLPRFPAAMRSLGVEGVARFQFVVDTLGLVEMASVREMSSTREAFAMAVRGTLPRMRFLPARVGGARVRQLVEFPIVFRIEK